MTSHPTSDASSGAAVGEGAPQRPQDEELATLIGLLEDGEAAQQKLAERNHLLWTGSREFARGYDALTDSRSFRLIKPLLRLLLSPLTLGFGATILDELARQRESLPR